jgi:hypothetical protein
VWDSMQQIIGLNDLIFGETARRVYGLADVDEP